MIEPEQATVYRAGKRRYLTLEAAAWAEAKSTVYAKYGSLGEEGIGWEEKRKIIVRLARFIKRKSRRADLAALEAK